ncbi:MAG TPA: hypothetical protein VJA23_00050 [Candidatus Nanoarchaeia archaeon]|nr:hypothetical protein [Candidatus Nanoarchaeia archaeon]
MEAEDEPSLQSDFDEPEPQAGGLELYLRSQTDDSAHGSLDTFSEEEERYFHLYQAEKIESLFQSIEAYQTSTYEETQETDPVYTGLEVSTSNGNSTQEDYSKCWTIFQTDRTPGMDYEVFYMVTEDDDDCHKITKLFWRLYDQSARTQEAQRYGHSSLI